MNTGLTNVKAYILVIVEICTVYFLCSQWNLEIKTNSSIIPPLITKFRLKLKKVGKITRPFRYDLNQTPYDYTMEVRNRFKGLDLIDRVPDEL